MLSHGVRQGALAFFQLRFDLRFRLENQQRVIEGVISHHVSGLHQFANNVAAEVGYVANKGTRLSGVSVYNIPLPGAGNVQARRQYPQWGVTRYLIWGGSSTYGSLQAKLGKRFSNGFSLLGAYIRPRLTSCTSVSLSWASM